jgi:DNA-binding transcriptional MerR regulator
MTDQLRFSPAQICQMFKIAKTTLFRWEQEKKISPTSRKLNGEREYTQDHIREIAAIQQEVLARQYEQACLAEDDARIGLIEAEMTRLKTLYLDSNNGLIELAERNAVPDILRHDLLVKASDLTPDDPTYKEIIELLYRQTQPEPA